MQRPDVLSFEELEARWSGELILIRSEASLAGDLARFDFSWLTGNAITLLLDVLFSVVFIAVMFMYSGWLTLVVVLSLPLYFIVSLLITPLLRARLNESFARGAEN